MHFSEQLRRAERLAQDGSLVIGSSPILTGGSPDGLFGGLPTSYGNWKNFTDVMPPLRAPEPPPKPEPMEVHVDWIGYRPVDAAPRLGYDDEGKLKFKGQTLQYVPDLGEPKSYEESREKLVSYLKQAIERTKFKPPRPRCDLDAGLELDREVIRRCGFPGRTSYMGEFREGRMTNQKLCVRKEGRQGIHAFSPSTDMNHAMEAAERTGVLHGRVLFYSPDAGWLFMRDDEYMAGGDRGRRGATTAAVAICRHLVDAVDSPADERA